MINPQIFASGIALLSGAFGRNASDAVAGMYFQVLSQRLSDAQFTVAISTAIERDTYWPSPARLVELAGISAADCAARAFTRVSDELRAHGGFRFFPRDKFLAFDAPTRAAIAAVGGLREITMVDATRAAALERRFIKMYIDTMSDAPTLAPGQRELAVSS